MTLCTTPGAEGEKDGFGAEHAEVHDLSVETISGLVDELFEREKIVSSERYVAIAIDGNSPYADIGRRVENEVFTKFGNDPEEMSREYDMYDSSSTFLVIVDQEAEVDGEHRKLPVGCLRLIANGANGIKTINDVASQRWGWHEDMVELIRTHVQEDGDPELDAEDRRVVIDNILDAGTLAVLPAYRYGRVSTALYHAGVIHTLRNGYRDWVMLIDHEARDVIQFFLNNPLQGIKGLGVRPYLGSEVSQPMYVNVPRYLERVREERTKIPDSDTEIYSVLAHGEGGLIDSDFDFNHCQQSLM